MHEAARTTPASSYEQDFAAWSQEQARVLRSKDPRSLDWSNLAEEIASLGGRERSEIRSRLRVLIAHLLKWQFQPERRSQSWQTTIGEQRIHIDTVIEDSPSLRDFPTSVLQSVYALALRSAAVETGLPVRTFPERLPNSIEQVLDEAFLPGRSWSPADLA